MMLTMKGITMLMIALHADIPSKTIGRYASYPLPPALPPLFGRISTRIVPVPITD
jgi:hypothetical protein